MRQTRTALALLIVCLTLLVSGLPASYDVVWDSQSDDSSGSMPVGGGDIGLNLWAEKNEILFYIAKSGTFDENNSLLKLGRVRLSFDPNPFGSAFEQRLRVTDGYATISAADNFTIAIWVDVNNPVIHVAVNSSQPVKMQAQYENWRVEDREISVGESGQASWLGDGVNPLIQTHDDVEFYEKGVRAVHANSNTNLTAFQLKQQKLEAYAGKLFNPRDNNKFGLYMASPDLEPGTTGQGVYVNTSYSSWSLVSPAPKMTFKLTVAAAQAQTNLIALHNKLQTAYAEHQYDDQTASIEWWHSFWNTSYIIINPDANPTDAGFQVGKNYQLWRYMMGCNYYGEWPMRFNGGLWTFDPVFVDGSSYTPDFRAWTGGTFTAQNQRLLYWPLLRSGDFEMMKVSFEFYRQITPTGVLRGQVYENLTSAFFTEQIDNTGLPSVKSFNNGPKGYQPGDFQPRPAVLSLISDNDAYIAFVFDTANEFADMILQANIYDGMDVTPYLEFIEYQLASYDLYYTREQQSRDYYNLTGYSGNEKFVIYPGSGQETYKVTYNSASSVSGLRKLVSDLLTVSPAYKVQNAAYYQAFLQKIPDTPQRLQQGQLCIAPAETYVRVQNVEIPQMYPVFPWGEYGLGAPNLNLATNTWNYDTETQNFHDNIGWKQTNIWVPRMGMTDEASNLTAERFSDSTIYRFSAWKGPNFDWSPDMNHLGSSAIGLQEQLMQTWYNNTIRIVPAWPSEWNVDFKLYAPQKTVVTGTVTGGSVSSLDVNPPSRSSDVLIGRDGIPQD